MVLCSWVLAGWRLIATFFYIFSPVLTKLQSYLLIYSINENGVLKKTHKNLHWMDPCSIVAQPLVTCVILGEHVNTKLRFFLCSVGTV